MTPTTLRLLSASSVTACRAGDVAHKFVRDFGNNGHGESQGVAYIMGPSKFLAYWTKGRRVVVKEVSS